MSLLVSGISSRVGICWFCYHFVIKHWNWIIIFSSVFTSSIHFTWHCQCLDVIASSGRIIGEQQMGKYTIGKTNSPVWIVWPVAEWDTCVQHGSWHLFNCPKGCVRGICSDGTLLSLSQQQVGLRSNMINCNIRRHFYMGGLYKNKINSLFNKMFVAVCFVD